MNKGFQEKLKELRAMLPVGYRKNVAKTSSEKVLLTNLFKRKSIIELTPGEKKMYLRLVDYARGVKEENKKAVEQLDELLS